MKKRRKSLHDFLTEVQVLNATINTKQDEKSEDKKNEQVLQEAKQELRVLIDECAIGHRLIDIANMTTQLGYNNEKAIKLLYIATNNHDFPEFDWDILKNNENADEMERTGLIC